MRGWPLSARRTKGEGSVRSVAELKELQFWHFTSVMKSSRWMNHLLCCGEAVDDNKWLHYFTTKIYDSDRSPRPGDVVSQHRHVHSIWGSVFISPPIHIHPLNTVIFRYIKWFILTLRLNDCTGWSSEEESCLRIIHFIHQAIIFSVMPCKEIWIKGFPAGYLKAIQFHKPFGKQDVNRNVSCLSLSYWLFTLDFSIWFIYGKVLIWFIVPVISIMKLNLFRKIGYVERAHANPVSLVLAVNLVN